MLQNARHINILNPRASAFKFQAPRHSDIQNGGPSNTAWCQAALTYYGPIYIDTFRIFKTFELEVIVFHPTEKIIGGAEKQPFEKQKINIAFNMTTLIDKNIRKRAIKFCPAHYKQDAQLLKFL